MCTKLFSAQLGNVISFTEDNNEFHIVTTDGSITKVLFYRSDIFRIWVGPNGELTNPASEEDTPIVVYKDEPIKINKFEENDYYKLESDTCILRIYKTPCMFALYKKDNTTLLFKENKPIPMGLKLIKALKKVMMIIFMVVECKTVIFVIMIGIFKLKTYMMISKIFGKNMAHLMRFHFI